MKKLINDKKKVTSMEIHKIQKLNKLAKDLKSHNIALSSTNAVDEAEKIFGNSPKMESKTDQIKELERDVRNLTFALKRNEEQVQELISKMNEMIKEINSLKEKPQPIKEKKGTKDPSKPIDRNKIAPKDVSVEKYFYFGKK